MKRCFLFFFLTAFGLSVCASQTHAQILRRACPSGACPTSARIVQFQRVYAPYSYSQAQNVVAPCDKVQTAQPCEPVAETTEIPEPCAPVAEIPEPCAPVQTCATEDVFPIETAENVCVDGTCPIRTAVRTAANATKGAVQTVASTTRWLLAVNRVRAQYNLPAFQGDVNLDAGCESQANYCARQGALVHGSGVAEILAQNQSGIDAAIVQWLNSPAHRSLMLSSSYRYAGVSVVRDKNGRVWCAMRFR